MSQERINKAIDKAIEEGRDGYLAGIDEKRKIAEEKRMRYEMKEGTRVVISDRFPADKLKMNRLVVGDAGKISFIHYLRYSSDGIALVDWDKGFRTTANLSDLDSE